MVLLNASRTAISLSIKSQPPRQYKYKLKASRETLTQPHKHRHTNRHTHIDILMMASQSSSTTGYTATAPGAKKHNVALRTAAPSGAATSRPPRTSGGTPAPPRSQPSATPPNASTPHGHALSKAFGGTPLQKNERKAPPSQAKRAPPAEQPRPGQAQTSGQKAAAPQVGKGRPSYSKGLQKSQDEFQVVKAPTMLKGEKPAPTSSPLIELMKSSEQALAMGKYQEKY